MHRARDRTGFATRATEAFNCNFAELDLASDALEAE
jgi:hypothetical protein